MFAAPDKKNDRTQIINQFQTLKSNRLCLDFGIAYNPSLRMDDVRSITIAPSSRAHRQDGPRQLSKWGLFHWRTRNFPVCLTSHRRCLDKYLDRNYRALHSFRLSFTGQEAYHLRARWSQPLACLSCRDILWSIRATRNPRSGSDEGRFFICHCFDVLYCDRDCGRCRHGHQQSRRAE